MRGGATPTLTLRLRGGPGTGEAGGTGVAQAPAREAGGSAAGVQRGPNALLAVHPRQEPFCAGEPPARLSTSSCNTFHVKPERKSA